MAAQESLRLMLTGDVMTGRGIDQVLGTPSAPQLFESRVRDARDYVRLAEDVNGSIAGPLPPEYIWGDALSAMERAAPDLRIVNLETAVTASDDAWPAKGIHYRMHPANVACLTAARLDCCVLANNHVLDWGRQGLLDTLQTLRQAGMHCAGAGADGDQAWAPAAISFDTHSRVLVFAAATRSSGVPSAWAAAPRRAGVALLPDLSEDTATMLAEDVMRRRVPGDWVVFSIHWGGNWGLDVPELHRAFAHRLIDLGAADVVHGHSSHHPLPVEVYRGRPIFYGCGDLLNDYEGIRSHGLLRSDVGCLYFVSLGRDGSGRRAELRQLDVLPMQTKRFRLNAADETARSWLESIFNAGDCRLGPPRAAALPASWSMVWPGLR